MTKIPHWEDIKFILRGNLTEAEYYEFVNFIEKLIDAKAQTNA